VPLSLLPHPLTTARPAEGFTKSVAAGGGREEGAPLRVGPGVVVIAQARGGQGRAVGLGAGALRAAPPRRAPPPPLPLPRLLPAVAAADLRRRRRHHLL